MRELNRMQNWTATFWHAACRGTGMSAAAPRSVVMQNNIMLLISLPYSFATIASP